MLLKALGKTQPKLCAYLSYMTERLIEMKRVLKNTGSIYLHCDPTASHYLKLLLDCIFGEKNFRNEIIWGYKTGGVPRSSGCFARKHDILFFYSKNYKKVHFNKLKEVSYTRTLPEPHTKSGKGLGVERDQIGKYRLVTMRDWWVEYGLNIDIDVTPLYRNNSERLGYPTQKPLKLLERIIKASSKEGDVVMDPFCGCATTLEAAHTLKRRWIGIDIAIHAIKRVASLRLKDRMGLIEGQNFELTGIPRNKEGAKELWERDKYHFQKWAVEKVDGFVTNKRTADGGIDGRIYFTADPIEQRKELKSMIIEVKGGRNISIQTIRALKGVLENDPAVMAGLITMDPLGYIKDRNFRKFMAEVGGLEILGKPYPKLQHLTVDEILKGERFSTPTVAGRGVREIAAIPGM